MICKVCREEYDERRFAQCPYCGADAYANSSPVRGARNAAPFDEETRGNEGFNYNYALDEENVDYEEDFAEDEKAPVGRKITVVIVAILAGILIFVAGLLLFMKISDGRQPTTTTTEPPVLTSAEPTTEEPTTEEPTTEEPVTAPQSTVYDEGGVAMPDFNYAETTELKVKSSVGLNVRKGPSTDAEKVGRLADGGAVTAKGYSGTVAGWLFISFTENGAEKSGWVKSEFVEGADALAGQAETTASETETASDSTSESSTDESDEGLVAISPAGSDESTSDTTDTTETTAETTKSEFAPDVTYASEEQKTKYVKVSDVKLNVRKGPAATKERITTLSNGTEVKVLGQDGASSAWVYISFTEAGSVKEGWVKAEYLSDTNS